MNHWGMRVTTVFVGGEFAGDWSLAAEDRLAAQIMSPPFGLFWSDRRDGFTSHAEAQAWAEVEATAALELAEEVYSFASADGGPFQARGDLMAWQVANEWARENL